jgi:hypothetical protein
MDSEVIQLLCSGNTLRDSVVEDEGPLLRAENPSPVQLHSETVEVRATWTAGIPASEMKMLIVGCLKASK